MNILIAGKPGSGKGTITQNLLDEGFIQLSTGDLLRAEEERDTPLGREIGALLKEGKFATDDTIFTLVNNFLKENAGKSVIFDGFPRNLKQAEVCLDQGIIFDHVFLINATDDMVKERIVNRRVHLESGRVYNLKTMPPKVEGKDDITGDPLTHRKDDFESVLESRLANYREKTEPILAFLKERQYEITEINGHAPISEQVQKVKETLDQPKRKNKPL